MSGVLEIAGLALAAFPLVISLLETYEKGYEGLQVWLCFRREFTHLLNELIREKILFGQQMEGLLRSITDSDFDMGEMLSNLQSAEWKSLELTSRLRKRLSGPGEFESYDSSVHSIHRNLDKMATKLRSCEPPDQSADGAFQGVFLQKKFYKLQFSLRKKKWQEQVIDPSRQIDRAGKLLGEAEALAPARQSRKTALGQFFEQAKNQASSLHKAIAKGWTCDCKDHAFKLVLNRAKVSEAPEAHRHAFKVSFPLRSRTWTRPEIILHEKDRWHTTETTMMPAPQQGNDLAIREECTERNSSISADSGSSLAPPSSISCASRSSQAASLSTTATTAMTTSSSWPRGRKVSFRESEAIRKDSSSPLSLPQNASLISDLCRVLQSYGEDACLGYLEDGQGSCHVFHTSTAPVLMADELERIVSLKAILDPRLQNEGARCELSRRDRLSIALTLSHALLQLYTTPWLPKSWSKTDVYFFQRRNGEIMTESPFLLCEIVQNGKPLPAKSPSRQDDFQDHADALLSLGILIMELWFGESIENRSLWRRHCDGQGEEKDLTRLMTAIEWQKQAKNEGGVVLHDITHRCVRGNFGMTIMNLGDDKCVGAVYEGVVKPLEGLLGYFWPD